MIIACIVSIFTAIVTAIRYVGSRIAIADDAIACPINSNEVIHALFTFIRAAFKIIGHTSHQELAIKAFVAFLIQDTSAVYACSAVLGATIWKVGAGLVLITVAHDTVIVTARRCSSETRRLDLAKFSITTAVQKQTGTGTTAW
jgi:hypothetical protein